MCGQGDGEYTVFTGVFGMVQTGTGRFSGNQVTGIQHSGGLHIALYPSLCF
ncbi:hypothetical protein CPAR01_11646 [Colletotrichum paranaense]|uniref:Uncharacterized protein n=1 Tax=Colletotrichum paranaense TaxID=1914294 RepID=A0ABQ9SC64_9PEZI|nr:uncharacterized protein CPAR01_11646 [Colletotrichum paranaense]KAK1531997.1 hypothetical protein CPAR01_11646 [Colletotrichum paranaense]